MAATCGAAKEVPDQRQWPKPPTPPGKQTRRSVSCRISSSKPSLSVSTFGSPAGAITDSASPQLE